MKISAIFKTTALCPLAILAGCAGVGSLSDSRKASDEIALALARHAGHAKPAAESTAESSSALNGGVQTLPQAELRTRASSRKKSSAPELPSLSGKLSLADSVTLALANNHDIKSAYLAKRASEGLIDQAYADAMPNAALSASAQNNFSADDHNDNYGLGVRITQPLWRGGAVAAGLRYAKYYAASADFTIREMASDIVFAVSEKYLSVLLNQQLASVYEEAAAVSERLLQTANSRRAQGVAPEYEVLRAQVEVANARADLINASNALRRAEITLFDTMGVSQESTVSFSGALAYEPERFDEALIFELAALNRPDLLKAQAAVFMARENLNVVKSDYRVKLDAFGNAGYNNNKQGDWDDEIIVGATASLQLYDGWKKRGKIAVAESQLAQSEVALRKAQDAARVEAVNALLQLDYSEELYDSQKKNINVAREALRMIEAGSRQGRNTQVEVLDARAAVTGAMGAYYRAIHSHTLAKLAIREAAGMLSAE